MMSQFYDHSAYAHACGAGTTFRPHGVQPSSPVTSALSEGSATAVGDGNNSRDKADDSNVTMRAMSLGEQCHYDSNVTMTAMSI